MSAASTGDVPEDVLLARAAWSRLVEPGDPVAGAVVAALGPVDAVDWLRDCARSEPAVGGDPVGLPDRRLASAVARWVPRLEGLDAERDLRALDRRGGCLLVPEDPRWPSSLGDLGPTAPHALWVLGATDLHDLLRGAVAVIGARASTAYGEHVAATLAAGVCDAGRTVVSGGAYGIDAVAHRAALGAGGRTVAVLAGGVDRLYPAGNARLLGAVMDQGGALVSEVPPGSVPSRSRFLQRNRVIAAVSSGTVVVEAAWRSGALSTAGHAAALLRPVGAVPGPVTSVSSAGCHRLLREGQAVCVTDVPELLELVSPPDAGEPSGAVGPDDPRPRDPAARRLLESLPVRGGVAADRLARTAGLGLEEVRGWLGRLEVEGLVARSGDRWSRPCGPQ
jgi:DNA processing protein